MKFVLLHEAKNDEGIRAFFMDVWELYVKVCRPPARASYAEIKECAGTDDGEPVPHGAHGDPERGVRCTCQGEREKVSVTGDRVVTVTGDGDGVRGTGGVAMGG